MEDYPIIPPPNNVTVVEKPKIVLYTHDNKPIIRVIGFRSK